MASEWALRFPGHASQPSREAITAVRLRYDYYAFQLDKDGKQTYTQSADGLTALTHESTRLADSVGRLGRQEVSWTMGQGITVMLRMDAVLRRKADKLLFVKDFKTIGMAFDGCVMGLMCDAPCGLTSGSCP